MLVAQALNFLILLVVLTIFVYRPLMRTMEERRKKIELGVKGGELAAEKGAAVDLIVEGDNSIKCLLNTLP